jgi:DNA-binding transcriptional LysR family regulator
LKREDLSDLMAFAMIAEEKSFTRAASRLGLSSSALSHAIRLLEERLGAKLLNRTTRSVAPTSAGLRLLGRLQPALQDIRHGLQELVDEHAGPSGLVRINSHRSAATLYVLPKLQTIRQTYPGITLDLVTQDSFVDIVSDGYDAGIRDGEQLAQDMVAVRIGPDYRTAVVASPGYLENAPPLEKPADLVRHACVGYRLSSSGALLKWHFRRGARRFEVAIDPVFTTTDMEMLIEAALRGAGVAYLLREQVAERLAAGTLIELVPKWAVTHTGSFLYHPGRRQMRPALRAVIDILRCSGD